MCRIGLGNLLSGLLSGPQADIKDSEPELMQWLDANGLPQQKVVVQQLPGQGRGLLARQRLSKAELLLQVPMNLVISQESVLRDSPIVRRIAGGVGYDLPQWTILALWLAEQRHLARCDGGGGGGGSSRWGPYLAVLPDAAGTVLDWKEGEVDRWLSGGLRTKARIITAADDASWSEVADLVSAAEVDGACPHGMFTRDSVRWAVGVLLSRSVRLDSAGGETVLVPFADFANHSVDADCFLDFDAGSGAVGVRLDRGYAPGEQVFISYGPKSSGELLLSYGFAPPPGSNPNDAAFLDLRLAAPSAQLDEQPTQQQQRGRKKQQQQQQASVTGRPAPPESRVLEAKRAAMAARGVPDSEVFGVRLDALPEGLLDYIAFLDAPLEDESDAEGLADALLSRGELPILKDGTSAEALALEGLARRCKQALKAYTQDPAADKRLADTVLQGGGYEQREALCASIRLRERAILSRTEFVALQRAKAIRRGQV